MKLEDCSIGQRVKTVWGETGAIEALEPHNSGQCNTLVRLDIACPRRGDLWAMPASNLRPE